jgi:hypothetical protein
MTGRELMAPVKFATACASCHLLAFDKRFEEGVPHDKPEVVQTFVATKFQEYIAAHPGELRVSKDPSRDLTGKPLAPDVRVLTPAQWIAERTAEAEKPANNVTPSPLHKKISLRGFRNRLPATTCSKVQPNTTQRSPTSSTEK